MANSIPITEWNKDDTPLGSTVSYGPEGSIEEYWTKMSANYAEVENGSLDDQFEKEFADDIFDVFRKSDDEKSEESGDAPAGDDDIGHTLLSFAQGMMHDDDDDYEEDDDYDDDEENDGDDDSGMEVGEPRQQELGRVEQEQEGTIAGMNLGDMHPNHTPLQGSTAVTSSSGPSHHSQHSAPRRPSPTEMKQLAAAYEIEQSEDEDEDDEDDDYDNDDDKGGGATGFLLDSGDDDDDDDPPSQPTHHPIKVKNKNNNDSNGNNNNGNNAVKKPQQLQQRQNQSQPKEQQKPRPYQSQKSQKQRQAPPKPKQPSHPFLRQESGGDKGGRSKKSKKDIEKKHKMLLMALVQKKRQEEEELLLAVRKAEAKRKKFKEALLEKAIRTKQLKAEEEEEKEQRRLVEKELKAAENPKAAVPRPRRVKPAAPVARPVLTQEQLEEKQEADEAALQREEDEARAKMEAAVRARKKFVKNQKAILAALQAKKDEKVQQQEQEHQEEQRLRELKRKRNEKFLRQREQKKSEQQEAEEEEGRDEEVVQAKAGVGSALSAVRATRSQEGGGGNHRPSKTRQPANTHRSASATNTPHTPDEKEGEEKHGKEGRAPRRRLKAHQHSGSSMGDQQAEGGKESGEVEDAAAKERRREEAKQRQEKVSQQLALLAEQRREAEQQAKRKEERAKARADLLRQRVQLEYSERKLMACEDKFVNGDTKMRRPMIGAQPVEEKKPQKKITTEMAVAMVDRMQAKKLQARNQAEGKENVEGTTFADVASQLLPPARDFLDWKKRHGVPLTDSLPGVFCMTGWYPCVKEALLERGWVHNQDPNSPHFDLKWTLKSSDVAKGSLQPWQLTNHFLKNVALTTKIGLMKSLQQLNWIADVSTDDIFPRGYDLSSPLEIQEYIDDFRHDHVVNVLKRLYLRLTGLETPQIVMTGGETPRSVPLEQCSQNNVSSEELLVGTACESVGPPPPSIVPDLDEVMVNKAVLNACFNVLTRYLTPHFAENGVDHDITVKSQKITAVEWELVQNYDLYATAALPDEDDVDEPVDEFLREKEREAALSAAQALPPLEKKKALADINHRARKEQYHRDKERERAADALALLVPLGEAGLLKLHTLLSQCKIVTGKQYGLNGSASGAKNMWIVKPAAKSRGRGIMAFNDLRKLLAYVELGKAGKAILTSSQWVVQKYMENPLIIANRKFDFRQWVLVASWNPLTVYFYDEFYCRFSSEDYDTSDEAMSNTFIHLVNNSIGKNNENFHKAIRAANGADITEFMWSDADFTAYAEYMTKTDATIKAIKSRMQDIAVWSLMCGSDAIEHRKNSWELYGFDYMMDDQWTPWLIEINSSPACDYSTKVTERYIKKALVEVLNVTLDVREWEKLPKGGRPEKPDTGGWECIFTGPTMDTNSFGTDMCVQGEPIKVPRRRMAVPRQHVLPPKEEIVEEDAKRSVSSRGALPASRSNSAKQRPPSSDESPLSSRGTAKPQVTPRTVSAALTQGSNQEQQPKSEIVRSPIDSNPLSAKKNPSVSPVQHNETEREIKAQASPIVFDDSDDDLSVDNAGGQQEGSSSAMDKLDNAKLTAHVKELVAVPVAVQQFDMPMTFPEAGGESAAVNKPRNVLKKGGGGALRKAGSQEGQPAASAIPIKTYDPFA